MSKWMAIAEGIRQSYEKDGGRSAESARSHENGLYTLYALGRLPVSEVANPANDERQQAANVPHAAPTIAPEQRGPRGAGVVTPEAELLAALASDALPDPAAEARRQRVLAMLAERPSARYALLTDTEAEPDAVILTLAIRGQATCELQIPRDRYDPFLLLELIERHGATVH